MKKFIALVLVLAVALVAFAGCGETTSKTTATTPATKTTPATATATAPATTPEPINDEAFNALSAKLKSGFTATLEVKDASGAILPVSIAAKIVSDIEAGKHSADIKLNDSEGNTAINVVLGLTKTFASVSEATLLGDKALGINFETVKADLAASVFAPESGSAYALDADTYASVVSMIDELVNANSAEKTSEKIDLSDIESLNALLSPSATIEKMEVTTEGDTTTAVVAANALGYEATATAVFTGSSYTVTSEVKGEANVKLVLSGKLDVTEDALTLTVDNVKLTQEGMELSLDLAASLKLEAAHEVTVSEEYVNVFTMTEEQINEYLGAFVTPATVED